MKWKIGLAVVSCVFISSALAPIWAEKPKTVTQPSPRDSTSKKSVEITQGEFAKWLVNVVGLARHLGPSPTPQECFQILLQNNIAPKDGWKADQVVKPGDLARIIVAAMGRTAEVQNPERDESFIEYLKTRGMTIGSAGEALNNLGLLMNPSASESVVISTDPLGKLDYQRPIDEQMNLADLGFTPSVFNQLDPEGPQPLTPN